jgi:RNA polymerase sigma-70 factor (ECF subfamily)
VNQFPSGDPVGESQRLSRISTLWTVVREAHLASNTIAAPAQRLLLERYGAAIRRYLVKALGNAEDADELFQEFACRFLEGKLRGADPGRGRFRDFTKGVLYHMIADFHNRRRRQGVPLPEHHEDLEVAPMSIADHDQEFLSSWREELLARSWSALEAAEQNTGQPFFTVLRFRADHPDMRSANMANELAGRLNKPLTSAGVRQLLHRAREKFAALLVDEVAQSLDKPGDEQLLDELENLGLIDYCRPALEQMGNRE